MAQTVFFSWQADTPTKVGRNFLKEVLEEVCQAYATDASVDEALREIEIDSDTQGVAGQPPIVDTIFKKIDSCGVFLADMTFVGTRKDGRATPNPNVLIEYGWALKSLKYERVICVMNTAYGEPSDQNLPFDLKHLRWPITYSLPEDATPKVKAEEKKKLASIFLKAIRASLGTLPPILIVDKPLFIKAISKDGPAKFRSKGELLGIDDDFLHQREITLSVNPAAIWLRVMPKFKLQNSWAIHELKEITRKNTPNLTPLITGGGWSYLRGGDGFGAYQMEHPEDVKSLLTATSVAFVFESGEMWSVDVNFLFYYNDLPFLEGRYIAALTNYIQFLKELGVQPPYTWIAGVTGIMGRHLQYPAQPGRGIVGNGPKCLVDTIEIEGEYNGEENIKTVLLPFFKRIFEKCGVSRPDYLN